MNEYQQELVFSFCEMCGCDFDIASQYLQCCDWSMDVAVSMFFENGGAPLQVQQPVKEEVNTMEPEIPFSPPCLCEHCKDNVKELKRDTLVYREECAYCFNTWEDSDGIAICLTCYLGFCTNSHSYIHFEKTGHALFLCIHRTEIPITTPNPQPLTKLAIEAEPPKEYITKMSVICEMCSLHTEAEGFYRELGERILLRVTGEKEKELCSWEAENLKPCSHCKNYTLPSPCPQVSTNQWKCENCDLRENLWLCLECGQFHCGRKQWDASSLPGNGHALDHFHSTGHSLAVKVASLQENRADVHCYQCDNDPSNNYGDVLFDRVVEVLTGFGIMHDGRVIGLSSGNHEKSLLEMNLLVNSEFQFSMNDENGVVYPPHQGPNACGLDNLGNSCYMSAILQVLFHSKPFIERLKTLHWYDHNRVCDKLPTDCLLCQFMKIGHAIREGKKNSVKPQMFKQVISTIASQFKGNQQQDCYEFLTVLLSGLEGYAPRGVRDLFSVMYHYRMKCLECGTVRDLRGDEDNCIQVQLPVGEEAKEKYCMKELMKESLQGECLETECACCGHVTLCNRYQVMDGFPAVLCIRVNRFIVDMTTYTIAKNTAAVELDDEIVVRQSEEEEDCISRRYRLRSACLHRGSKADFGHYVAVYKEEGLQGWVLCNDSKVVEASEPPVKECYLVFYELCEE